MGIGNMGAGVGLLLLVIGISLGWWFRGAANETAEHRRLTRNFEAHVVTGVVERARVSREERVAIVKPRGWSWVGRSRL